MLAARFVEALAVELDLRWRKPVLARVRFASWNKRLFQATFALASGCPRPTPSAWPGGVATRSLRGGSECASPTAATPVRRRSPFKRDRLRIAAQAAAEAVAICAVVNLAFQPRTLPVGQ